MNTDNQTGMRRITMVLTTALVIAGAVLQAHSGYQLRQVLRDVDAAAAAHVRSVALMIREGARQAAVSTSLIYEMAEENLSTTAQMIASNGRYGLRNNEIAANDMPLMFVDHAETSDRFIHVDESLQLQPDQIVQWMAQQPVNRLVEDGPVGAAGLICLRYSGDDARGIVCDSAEYMIAQRRESGIGPLLRGVVAGSVRYAAIQDESGILAAFPGNLRLSRFTDDTELAAVQTLKWPVSRLLGENAEPIHEGLASFQLEDESTAVLRVGIDASTSVRIQRNAKERWLTTTLLTVGLITLALIGAWLLNRMYARRQALEEQTAAALEMQKHWELIGGLAASVAHEVRNPLHTIKMVNERLGREMMPAAKNDEMAEMLEIVNQEAKRVEAVVQGFLDLGKPHRVAVVQISALESVTYMLAGMQIVAQRKGVRLTIDISPEIRFSVDNTLLERIVRNLVSNAIMAASHGGEVVIQATEDSAGLVLRISDNGAGMTPDQTTRAMKPFHTTRATGVGLGLPIVVRSIELLGGTFSIESAPGCGTTAVVRLPRRTGAI